MYVCKNMGWDWTASMNEYLIHARSQKQVKCTHVKMPGV